MPTRFEGYPAGTRALQLPDTRVDSYFLTVFGRPERVLTSAAERQMDPTLPQALHAINGDTLNKKLMDRDWPGHRLARGERSGGDIVDELYLSALSRRPSDEERQALAARIDAAPTGARSWRISRGRCSHPGNSCSPTESRGMCGDCVNHRCGGGGHGGRADSPGPCRPRSLRRGYRRRADSPPSSLPLRPTTPATSSPFSRRTACGATVPPSRRADCCSTPTKTW